MADPEPSSSSLSEQGRDQRPASAAPPIRIAFCITELDPGGAERALTQLVLNLDRNRWQPLVICLGPPGHFADVLTSAGIDVVCLNAKGLWSVPRIFYRVTKELRRFQPVLLQTFLFHANIVGRIAARLAGVKTVVSGLRVAERRAGWHGIIDRWTNGLVKTNVCVSRGVADFSRDVVGLSPSKLVVIPNAVQVEQFAKAAPANLTQFGIPAGSQTFISIGRLDRQKGFDVLIDAVAALTSLPADIYFLIVGEGPESGDLQEQVIRANLSDRIRFSSRRSDVPNLLAASMALILPSRWEGMPNVVLEAMAAGRPVIATQVEGIAELVQDGVTGLIVQPEQPGELARAIQRLLADPHFVVSAGTESQALVLKSFTTQQSVTAYEHLYETLLK